MIRRSLYAALAVALVPAFAAAEAPPANEIAATSPSGNYLAARIAGTSRDMEAAAAYYRAALRADPRNPDLIERTFLTLVADGSVEQAASLGERLLGHNREHRVARLVLAARALKRGQFAAARTHLGRSGDGPIADLTSGLIGAWALAGAGEVKTAIANVDRLQGPEWYVAFKDLHAGLILDFAGQRRDAGKRFARAYELDKNSLRAVDAYARWNSRNGKRETALEAYAAFSKVLPDHPMIKAAVAELEAGRPLSPLVRSVQAGAAEVLFGLGSALGRQGGEDLGLVYLQLALYLEPEHGLALLSLSDLHETQKNYAQSIKALARVPAGSPLKRHAEIQRALNLDALERTAEAKKLLQSLIEQDPNDTEAIIALGNILRARKEFKEAAEVYSRAVALVKQPERQHWSLFYYRGICYERSKDWPNAEKDFLKALELFPDQPQVLNYLGYSWVDQGVHLDKALPMIKRAVELRPNDGYIVDSLGWAYYRLGQYEDATRELERAIELRPEDPVINDHLGDAYWKVGRRLESYFQWRHARDLKPEPEDLVKIEQKLREGLRDEPPSKSGAVTTPGGG